MGSQNPDDPLAASEKPRRFRFRVWTLMLAVLIVALAAALVGSARREARLRIEIELLRAQLAVRDVALKEQEYIAQSEATWLLDQLAAAEAALRAADDEPAPER
jgi:hypothetical protein